MLITFLTVISCIGQQSEKIEIVDINIIKKEVVGKNFNW